MRVYFTAPDVPTLAKDHMLVDMHFHSNFSHDSATTIQSIIKKCKELGVSIALTDHNAIGGVLAAEKLAPGLIKPSVEICTAEGKEIIPYFYSVRELVEFFNRVVDPKLKKKTSLQSNATALHMDDLLDELRRCNCVIALPHPFALPPRRSYKFFKEPQQRPMLKHIHAFEVINQTMLHKQNLAAIGWAMQFDKAIVGGTDGHILAPLGTAFTVGKADSWEEFLNNVKRKQVAVIGEERLLRHQMVNATTIIREKAKFIRNMRKGKES